jgi:hypothetical protein
VRRSHCTMFGRRDSGFRPGAARNRTVARTQADYLIFVDGDCVPALDFVRSP